MRMCKILFLRNFSYFAEIHLKGNAAEIDSFEEDEDQILKNLLHC